MADSHTTQPPHDRPNTHPADIRGAPATAPALSAEDRRAAKIGVGCFTTFIGAVSGAMIGVLIAVGNTFATRCTPLEGLPACNWHIFAGWGALIGAMSLPTLALWRLRRRERAGG
jgi:hypothetical protein